jgi:hypothetical protein
MTTAAATLIVREIADGDFVVVKGGDVYRKFRGTIVPGQVRAGDTASAAEICEWIELGVSVGDAPAITKAGFREYAQHVHMCATNHPNRFGDTHPCDCGFDQVRAALSKAKPA